MAQLDEILTLVRTMNADEFREQLTQGNSLDDLHRELSHLNDRITESRRRIGGIIDHLEDCFSGNFFNELPVSDKADELDVISMGFNTYIEELRATMVSKEELEKTNAKLRAEKERSERLSAAKDEFMSSMSHEIRTPLNGILGFTNILLNNNVLPPEYHKQLGYVKVSGDILLVIINDILDLAKIDAGKMALEESPIRVKELAGVVLNTFTVKSSEKELDLQLEIDDRVPNTLLGDSVRISQVLFNFISNAVKFTPARGTIRLSVKLEKEENDLCSIRLSVADTGIGISPDKIGDVFAPFVQTSNDTARKYGGTGLGLTIVKRIIDLMAGEVFVESDLGAGTTFTAIIPLKRAADLPEAEELPAKEEETGAGGRTIRVLLAEDNAINRHLVQAVLSKYNMVITSVENGKLAVEAIKKSDFDIILMDLMMPEMDGYEATTVIRNLPQRSKKQVPIVALTAVVTNSVTDRCRETGMNDYISKPFDAGKLHDMILKLTEQSYH